VSATGRWCRRSVGITGSSIVLRAVTGARECEGREYLGEGIRAATRVGGTHRLSGRVSEEEQATTTEGWQPMRGWGISG